MKKLICTNGDWTLKKPEKVESIPSATTTEVVSSGKIICKVYATQRSEGKANAHLLAAANALYESVNDLLNLFDKGFELGSAEEKYCTKAYEAVLKAQGV